MTSRFYRLGVSGFAGIVLAGLLASGAPAAGQAAEGTQIHKGLEITVSNVARSTNVSLGDCRPGANSVRGVIRPGDTREFVSVTIDIKVLPDFQPVIVAPPLLHDAEGNTYRTAQAFTDLDSVPEYSCEFSFRVPAGTGLASLAIEDATFDLTGLDGQG